jgi:SAM-dependent methyltransferase
MLKVFIAFARKVKRYFDRLNEYFLIRRSGLFDKDWYLAKNPDIVQAKKNPFLHYLLYGGFEGRDPSTCFCSHLYLDSYEDVKKAGINPLIHYLKYGEKEGRTAMQFEQQVQKNEGVYRCSVCLSEVSRFIPLNSSYIESLKKYNYPFTTDDAETMNAEQYECPVCHAVDRDRLYALYLERTIDKRPSAKVLTLLDIAPSQPLKMFLRKYSTIMYLSADKYMGDTDIVVDIVDMVNIRSGFFDIFICSHVLEHVTDDRKALKELFRILRPGGFGILMVPINLKITKIDEDPTIEDAEERWRRFGQDDHVRQYSKNGFIARIKDAGFVLNQYGVNFFGKEDFIRYGISLRSVLYVVGKN